MIPPLKKGGRGDLQQVARERRTSNPPQSPFCKGGGEAPGAQGWLDVGIWRWSFFDQSSSEVEIKLHVLKLFIDDGQRLDDAAQRVVVFVFEHRCRIFAVASLQFCDDVVAALMEMFVRLA